MGCLAGDEFVGHLRIAVSHEAILEISVVYQLQQAVSGIYKALVCPVNGSVYNGFCASAVSVSKVSS